MYWRVTAILVHEPVNTYRSCTHPGLVCSFSNGALFYPSILLKVSHWYT
jgi:hypothetical protein